MIIQRQWQQVRRNMPRRQAVAHLFHLYFEVLFLNISVTNAPHSAEGKDDSGMQLRYWFPHVNFSRFGPLNVVRAFLQVFWLTFFLPAGHSQRKKAKAKRTTTKLSIRKVRKKTKKFMSSVIRPKISRQAQSNVESFGDVTQYAWLNKTSVRILMTIIATGIVAFTVQLPMTGSSQVVMLLFFWAVALWVRDVKKRGATLLMIVLSILVSTRYLYWRVTETINWDVMADTLLSLTLLSAELYAWTILILGYIQTAWPLGRQVAELPKDSSTWPSVDVYIPSYNEPLEVVKPTVLAALGMDWPADKLNIYLLDDGNRAEFASFAQAVGAGYIARADNTHAKAGNLNNALKLTNGDFIAIFDCDHIPTRSFLQLAMGWFDKTEDLALLQTPHHFFSPDPFEKNLTVFRHKPNEGELFYG